MNQLAKTRNLQVSLVNKTTKNFNALWGPVHERPLVDRVVSTSQWPVPYYQRLYKAYPIREKKDKLSLLLGDIDIDDTNWYQAKEVLRKSYKGREIVNWVENNLDTSSYILIQSDVSNMAKAYVSDLAHFLNCANNENKRILSKNNLI